MVAHLLRKETGMPSRLASTHAEDVVGVLDDRLPSIEEIQNANALRRILAAEIGEGEPVQLELVGEDGKASSITLMPAVARSLLELLRHVSQGRSVTLVPMDAMLTTQKAADLLNVSRPHLIKLIDQGVLGHEMVGKHRRLRAEDVLAYRNERTREREAALSELARHDADLI